MNFENDNFVTIQLGCYRAKLFELSPALNNSMMILSCLMRKNLIGQKTTKFSFVDDRMRLRSLLERYLGLNKDYQSEGAAILNKWSLSRTWKFFPFDGAWLYVAREDGLIDFCRRLRQKEQPDFPFKRLTVKVRLTVYWLEWEPKMITY